MMMRRSWSTHAMHVAACPPLDGRQRQAMARSGRANEHTHFHLAMAELRSPGGSPPTSMEERQGRDQEGGAEGAGRDDEPLERVLPHAEVCLNRFVLVPMFQSIKSCTWIGACVTSCAATRDLDDECTGSGVLHCMEDADRVSGLLSPFSALGRVL